MQLNTAHGTMPKHIFFLFPAPDQQNVCTEGKTVHPLRHIKKKSEVDTMFP